jgi:hypothetical protein
MTHRIDAQLREPEVLALFDLAVEWLSENVSECKQIGQYARKRMRSTKIQSNPTALRYLREHNPKFDNVVAHYMMMADEVWSGLWHTKASARAVGDGWAVFAFWHYNLDGYLENHFLFMTYNELDLIQLKLTVL